MKNDQEEEICFIRKFVEKLNFPETIPQLKYERIIMIFVVEGKRV